MRRRREQDAECPELERRLMWEEDRAIVRAVICGLVFLGIAATLFVVVRTVHG